ncbi:MAG: tetratricopeptide repeat protein [Flavobacteriales bacterium]|nr:tetratricopeptide repeat protein [Flavobacteriales bacterium]
MDRLVLIAFIFSFSFTGLAQDDFKRNMYKGNLFWDEQDYERALEYFNEAVDESPLNFKANFNVANTHYQMKNFDKAADLFSSIHGLAPTRYEESKVFHNMGNAYLMDKKLDEAIDAYKQGLRLNPSDEATRYNLAYAQFLKKKQEEQQQNNPQNQNQNQNQEGGQDGENQNQDNQNDQNQDENQGDQNNQNGDKGDQNQDDQGDQGDQGDKNQNDQGNSGDEGEDKEKGKNQSSDSEKNNKGDKGSQVQSSSGNRISKEQAKRLLEAAYKREKEIQKELEKRKIVGNGKAQKKDW